jgi:mannose-6-phosphate isomerase-like protein (cupin superfamily)
VIQPPEIRHRVLESSENLEVIEIGVPAEHVTTIDHEMELPNGVVNPDRDFQGSKFVLHRVADAEWRPWRIPGFEARETGIASATQGVAGVQVARRAGHAPARASSHDTDILFTFVMEGAMTLEGDGRTHDLVAGDAFVIPPHMATTYRNRSTDLELLEVSLPGVFETILD